MKKYISIFLAMLLLLTSCQKPQDKVEAPKIVPKSVASRYKLNQVPQYEAGFKDEEFKVPTYEKKYEDYEVKPDLSNVLNLDQLEGISSEQKEALVRDKFFVSRQKEPNYTKIYNVYENNYYTEVPNFITTDAALHIYHILFDNALKNLEEKKLFPYLTEMTSIMTENAKRLYDEETDKSLKENLLNSYAYFAVASEILGIKNEIPDEVKEIVSSEMKLIEEKSETTTSKITESEINYRQFTPRGHYTGNENLEKYFKTMMWYGLLGFGLKDNENPNFKNIANSLLITYIAFMDESGKAQEDWNKIYEVTNAFAGPSDDLTIYDMLDFSKKVYGEDAGYENFFNEEFNDKIKFELENLRKPEIVAKLMDSKIETGLQFRLMGQRFTIDGNILQNLIDSNSRPIPTSLDVANVLGAKSADEIVKSSYLDKMGEKEYDKRKVELEEKFNDYDEKYYKKNLYNGWIWTLKSVFNFENEDKNGYPSFMKNKNYNLKNLSTGLSSYAELKHNTLLYSKQPMAEMGLDEPVIKYPSYVEPNVELYEKLIYLAKRTDEIAKKYPVERVDYTDTNLDSTSEIVELYEFLRDISIKELEGTELTEEEKSKLLYIGGTFEYINIQLVGEEFSYEKSNSVVADISSNASTGEFLEVATGLPDMIYVLIPYNGSFYITVGSVYNFKEFTSEHPLTDDDWETMQGYTIDNEKFLYGTYDPTKYENIKNPDWVYNYKTDKNEIQIKMAEFDYD